MDERLVTITEQLRGIVEQLDDLAFDELREAVATGAKGRPEAERRMTRARHGLERVIGILDTD